ncbi:hypothetical protein ACWCXX_10580 [Streptomyces sp. NPDC001732]
MDTLVTVVVVLAMIAFAAYVIHLLNARHRHQHLRPVHYDHGLAGFGESTAPDHPSRSAAEPDEKERGKSGESDSGSSSGR